MPPISNVFLVSHEWLSFYWFPNVLTPFAIALLLQSFFFYLMTNLTSVVLSFSSHHFVINSVWVLGFARSVQLFPTIVICCWCFAVLFLWQRLVCSISDGGRTQMRLWSAWCHKRTYKLLMNSLCEEHNAFVLSAACLVGWVDSWWVYRDIEDVKDFESESFILGCRLPLPPFPSLCVLSFSLFPVHFFRLRFRACLLFPKTLKQQHLFSCSLAVFVWHSTVLCAFVACFVCLRVCYSHMQTL